ncbi:MAG: acetolactate synthase small subunit [Candidatus Humimicrobiaceae bacterium]
MENGVILILTVNNHPGVMSHITGLFSRRTFNLEGILCAPFTDGTKSRIYLLVNEDERLEQITRQLSKLYDVLGVEICLECDRDVFDKLHEIIGLKEKDYDLS